MDVMVTGGAGYIGSVIVARLIERGYAVTVYDSLFRGHAAAIHPEARFVQGDIRDSDSVRQALAKGRCEAVIHMAALAEVGESVAHPGLYEDVNIAGTASVIAASVAAGTGKLVFSSTAAVYGAPSRTPILETDDLAPTNPYGETKLAGERLLAQAQGRGELVYSALRYFNACGAAGALGEDHEPETHLIPLALRAARDGTSMRVFGNDYPTADGTCVRDYIHVTDLADAHIAALERLPASHGSFNLGTGSGDSVMEVLETVRNVTGLPLRVDIDARRPGDPPVLVAGNHRAGDGLGWSPRFSLRDAVEDAWEWTRAHSQGYDD